MNREKFANKQRGKSPQPLEGSRFVTRQLCRLAASGSRERLLVMQFYRPGLQWSPSEPSRWGKNVTLGNSREPPVCPEGFRWLPADRTAALSRGRGTGSPPRVGVGYAVFVRRAN
jgi:hypothetical protein